MKTYISVNIVSQALILISAIKKHKCDCTSKIDQLKLPYGINRDAAMSFLRQCGWLLVDNDSLCFTRHGEYIASVFNGVLIDQALWRVILARYIEMSEPAWAKRIPYGRKEAYLFMTTEEQRCFDEAGLMESTEPDVIEWWDILAESERAKKDSLHLDVGREGERLTVLFEKQRIGITPDWISIESNLAGFDILSRQTESSDKNILIEVKSSQKPRANASCIVTRHEWETAQQKNNQQRYFFYLWDLSSTPKSLAIVDVNRMLAHIPTDSNSGKWLETHVPFEPFSDLFHAVTINE